MRPSARQCSAVIALACSLTLLAAGCGGSDQESSAGSGDDDGPRVELTIATFNEFGYSDLYREYEGLHPNVKITVAKKADSLYPCVSAASVCAKVTRDSALEVLYTAHRAAVGAGVAGPDDGMAWGSGYPSDARCVTWMKANMHPVFGWGPECRPGCCIGVRYLECRALPRCRSRSVFSL